VRLTFPPPAQNCIAALLRPPDLQPGQTRSTSTARYPLQTLAGAGPPSIRWKRFPIGVDTRVLVMLARQVHILRRPQYAPSTATCTVSKWLLLHGRPAADGLPSGKTRGIYLPLHRPHTHTQRYTLSAERSRQVPSLRPMTDLSNDFQGRDRRQPCP